jgi:hypothetical protein
MGAANGGMWAELACCGEGGRYRPFGKNPVFLGKTLTEAAEVAEQHAEAA